MLAGVKRAIIWAVDGSGSRLQGRPAVGVVFLLMVVPITLNVTGMYFFGYGQNSGAYRWMTIATVICWVMTGCYMIAMLAFGLYRLGEALVGAFPDSRVRRRGRKQTDGG